MAAVRSHWDAIYSNVSDVDEAPVFYVDEKAVAKNVRADDGSRYVRDDERSWTLPSLAKSKRRVMQ